MTLRNNTQPESRDTQSATSWEIRQKGMSRDYDIIYAGAPDSSGKIARVFARDGRDPIAQKQARLIAAAPTLLAALERAVKLYGKQGGPWNVPGDRGAWIEQAREAIKLAKGKEHMLS